MFIVDCKKTSIRSNRVEEALANVGHSCAFNCEVFMTDSKFQAFSALCAEVLADIYGIEDAQFPAAALRDEDEVVWQALREAADLVPEPINGFDYRVVGGVVEVL